MTLTAQQRLGPWILAAGLLHVLVLLTVTLAWQDNGMMASTTYLPRLTIQLTGRPIAAALNTSTHVPAHTAHTPQRTAKHQHSVATPDSPHAPHHGNQATLRPENTTPTTTASKTDEHIALSSAPSLEQGVDSRATTAARSPSQQHKHATPAADRTDADNELTRLLYGAINRHKHYPRTALRMAWQGTASVRFLLQQDGRLGSLTLLHSSGYNSLDQAALQAVQNISPFAPAQHYLDGAQTFNVDVVFNLYN